MIGSGTKPCKEAKLLEKGEACETQCRPGLRDLGGSRRFSCEPGNTVEATLSCGVECPAIDRTYWQDGIEPALENGCTDGRQLRYGDSCAVRCAKGYTLYGGTAEYSCEKEQFLAPTLSCRANDCAMPSAFPLGVKPADYGRAVYACAAGAVLPAGQSCFVACSAGYDYVAGSTEYSCRGGALFPPTLP